MKPVFKYFTLGLLLISVSCGTTKRILGIDKNDRQGTERMSESRKETVVRTRRSESVGSAPKPVKTYANKIDRYIGTYATVAMEEMELYKIPASITLAQGILESGAGEGDLTRRANNHFGIKCHGWDGGKVYHDDDESQECFRKYRDAKYSFRDHSLFLSGRGRYADLFELDPDDYKGWARGLRAAGYATDRKYPDKLIDIIERYQLYRYDAEVLGKDVVAYSDLYRLAETHIVKKGETLYSIGKEYGLSVEQLKQLNHLSGTTIAIGQVLYVTSLSAK